ncbi:MULTISPECIES: DegT/DnrJ/EryC1/StrS family aminotransferase [Salinibaculum]|uniref:DegT/DnrJ/EryC1/StrS family aminotransferase n=1 Tax=Salinibaculum TaxID=2732368 RepID=UPI0030CB90FA
MDIPLALPTISDEMVSEVERVLRNEFFLRGETVAAFEESFAEYVGTDEAVAVSSGTDALHLSLEALGVGPGDAVVTTPATFISTANAIVATGAEPVFVDVDLDTYTIDTEQLETVVDRRDDVAAILPVHLYGYPVDIDAVRSVAGDVPVLSDACQAHGATLRGERVGSIADVATFSFYPSKNMTVAGDGGMVTTDDPNVADMVRSLRDVGRGEGNYEHPRIGYTARMDTMNAAVGKGQLRHLDDWNERRRDVATAYTDGLDGIGDLVLPPDPGEDRESAWYLYVVRTADRDALQSHLEAAGVETGIHYSTPVHLHPPYRDRGFEPGAFPEAERWAEEVLSLPMHPQLTDQEVEYVVESVRGFFA